MENVWKSRSSVVMKFNDGDDVTKPFNRESPSIESQYKLSQL